MMSAYPRFHRRIATSATRGTILDVGEPRIKITEAEGQPPLIHAISNIVRTSWVMPKHYGARKLKLSIRAQ